MSEITNEPQKKENNLVWHKGQVGKKERSELLGFNNKVIWLTGLSGSGKSTIGHLLEKKLYNKKILVYVLDGDNIRHGLNSNLDFSPKDRKENIRRISEVAKLFYDSGIFVIVSFISPYKSERKFARKVIGKDFIEIFVDCPLNVCEERDPKGMYKKARANEIKDFTGVSKNAPYEKPDKPEIIVDSSKMNIKESVNKIIDYLNLK